MNISNTATTESENRIRKHWLLSIATSLVFIPTGFFAFFFFMSLRIPIPANILIAQLAPAIGGLLSLWLIWHCPYKKHGTKLLSVWMVLSPIRMLASIAECFKQGCNSWISALNLKYYLNMRLGSIVYKMFDRTQKKQDDTDHAAA